VVGYGRFDGIETARVMARLYAAARLHVNFFQPSFKLKEKRREGAKVIKRYHAPATPYGGLLRQPMPAHPLVFARALAMNASTGEVRATHRRVKGKYKTRMRMPSKLDPSTKTARCVTEPLVGEISGLSAWQSTGKTGWP
jgi:hypothetical protein